MSPDHLVEPLGIRPQAAQVVPRFLMGALPMLAGRLHLHDGPRTSPFPSLVRLHPADRRRIGDHPAVSPLQSSMPLVERFMPVQVIHRQHACRHGGEGRLGQREGFRLVRLQRQHVVGLRGNDRGGQAALAAHRDDRPLRHHLLQQVGQGRDLVLVVRHLALPQGDSRLGRPGRDRVQRRYAVPPVVGAAGGLAVDGNLGGGQQRIRDQGVHPVLVTGGELLGIEQGEDAAEGVVGGDPMGEGQVGAEPRLLGPPPEGDGRPGIGASDGGGDRDDDDLREGMLKRAVDAGVMEINEDQETIGPIGTRHAGILYSHRERDDPRIMPRLCQADTIRIRDVRWPCDHTSSE